MNDAVRKERTPRIETREMLLEDPRRGFASFGHFAHAVIRAGRDDATDPRLTIIAAAPTTFGDEAVGADGGFAVPPAFADEVYVIILGGDSLMPLCDRQQTSRNSMTYPIDEAAPWGTNGVIAAWQVEGVSLSQVKPLLNANTLRLHKLLAFVPLTDELVNDAPALQTYLPRKVADAISWKFNHAILQGNGNGQPEGILNAPCTVVQAKDTGQATLTVSITNATNMLTRLPPGSHGRAVFIANTSVLGGLTSLGAGASGYGMSYSGDYVPGTNIPMVGRLVGRPVIPTAHLSPFSSQGDLILVDLTYYTILTRPNVRPAAPVGPVVRLSDARLGSVEIDWSFDVFFDADACALRARFRCDGQAMVRAPISPPAGGQTATYSPFIQLAAR